MANVSLRSLLSLKQKSLITAWAKISNPLRTALPTSSAVQSHGFTSESTMPITKGKKGAKKSASLLNLLRDYGFQDSQTQKLFECRVLHMKARKLKPKLDYLKEKGFTGELLPNLIVSCPGILRRSLDACIKPNFQLLKQYLDSDEKVVTAITRFGRILYSDLKRSIIPNIEFLINEGVPVNRVSHMLLTYPRVFLLSRDRVAYAVKTVKEFGIAPDETQFIHCLRVVCQLTESNLKKKLQVFKSFGWSDEQVSNGLKRCLTFLSFSEEKLRSKIGFYVNTVKLEPDIFIHYPALLTYSVERISARYEFFKILKSKELIEGVRFTSVVSLSEDLFRKRYVIKYEKRAPGISDIYCGMVNERKNRQGEKTET